MCISGWGLRWRYSDMCQSYQDIFTADMRPFDVIAVLFTSFSCFFNLCSTSFRSRSSRRFSRNADSASMDKSSSSSQPTMPASSSVPSSLLCNAQSNTSSSQLPRRRDVCSRSSFGLRPTGAVLEKKYLGHCPTINAPSGGVFSPS